MRFSMTSFARAFCACARSDSSASAAVRNVVMRIVFAWKNDHKLDASMLWLSEAVWALLPSVSEKASPAAITAISSATFLLDGSMWPPCPDITITSLFIMRVFCCVRAQEASPRRGLPGTAVMLRFQLACNPAHGVKERKHEVRRLPASQHPLLERGS